MALRSPYSGPERRNEGISRQVAIAIMSVVITVFIQTAGIIWWASGITHRVEAVEKSVAKHDDTMQRLTIMETNVTWIKERMQEVLNHAYGRPRGS